MQDLDTIKKQAVIADLFYFLSYHCKHNSFNDVIETDNIFLKPFLKNIRVNICILLDIVWSRLKIKSLDDKLIIINNENIGGCKMKISTKGRYGLEALLDLAIHSSEGHASIKNISERCGMSETYILQIFLVLRRAGIVESVRGAQGGYMLARDPSEITVGDVLTALEGPLAPVACIVEGTDHPCDRYENCTTRGLWESIMNTLSDVANSITIEDLVKCYNRRVFQNKDLEYYL